MIRYNFTLASYQIRKRTNYPYKTPKFDNAIDLFNLTFDGVFFTLIFDGIGGLGVILSALFLFVNTKEKVFFCNGKNIDKFLIVTVKIVLKRWIYHYPPPPLSKLRLMDTLYCRLLTRPARCSPTRPHLNTHRSSSLSI